MEQKLCHTFAILAYKESPYLEECIQSVLGQSVKSAVYISTSTPSPYISGLAEKYGLPLYINEKEPGIASDWQFAADQCETPYLTLAHQDDVYYKTYTEKLLPYMKNSIIGFCDYEELVNGKPRRKTKMLRIKRLLLWPFYIKKSIKSKFFKKAVLRLGSPICCPAVTYNRELCGGPVFNPEYKNDLDWDAWLTFAGKPGRFTYEKQVYMAHRIHEDSETTKQIESSGRAAEDLKMFSRMWPGWIARRLAKMYAGSYASNDIAEEKKP